MVGVIARFRLSGRHVADRFEEAAVVEPVDPFEGSELDRLKALPWAKAVDDLGLVEAADGLREGVVLTVADAADGGIDAGLDQTLSIVNGNVLAAPVAMMNQAALMGRAALMDGLLEGIQHEFRPRFAILARRRCDGRRHRSRRRCRRSRRVEI